MTQGARTSARGYNVPIATQWPSVDQTRSDLSCWVTCCYVITMLLHENSNGDKWWWTAVSRDVDGGYMVPTDVHWPSLDQTRLDLSCGVTCYYMITMLLHENSNGDKWWWTAVSTGTCGWGVTWCQLICISVYQTGSGHLRCGVTCYYMITMLLHEYSNGDKWCWPAGSRDVGGGYMMPTDAHWPSLDQTGLNGFCWLTIKWQSLFCLQFYLYS